MILLDSDVLYFNQPFGAGQPKHWSKSFHQRFSANLKNPLFVKFCCKFFILLSLFGLKTLKMHISTSLCGAQHPNAGFGINSKTLNLLTTSLIGGNSENQAWNYLLLAWLELLAKKFDVKIWFLLKLTDDMVTFEIIKIVFRSALKSGLVVCFVVIHILLLNLFCDHYQIYQKIIN